MINYFQAIHSALFYKKNAFEMFKSNLVFLDLLGCRGQNKNQLTFEEKNLRFLLDWLGVALESAIYFNQNNIFGTFKNKYLQNL